MRNPAQRKTADAIALVVVLSAFIWALMPEMMWVVPVAVTFSAIFMLFAFLERRTTVALALVLIIIGVIYL